MLRHLATSASRNKGLAELYSQLSDNPYPLGIGPGIWVIEVYGVPQRPGKGHDILQIYRFGSSGVILTLADLQLTQNSRVAPGQSSQGSTLPPPSSSGRGRGRHYHNQDARLRRRHRRGTRCSVGLRWTPSGGGCEWTSDGEAARMITRTPKCRHVVAKGSSTNMHLPAHVHKTSSTPPPQTNQKKLSITAPAPHVPSVSPHRPTSTHSHHRWESNASQPSSACRGDDDDAAARPGCGSGGPCRAPTTTVAEGWSPVRQSKFCAALL
ncbi:hypothetical protein EDB89DRAFT_2239063 [Lactarius sanguifluus]|nr:hypothetical protein EDB89DRAFT_2239063 [Lactarius sanguifluus]